MKIAVIGAGAAGLAALRQSLQAGHECEAFEKSDQLGGTWFYNENTGMDSNGLPIHSSMYVGLKTNLPKELMSFEGFPYREPHHSYIKQPDVLNYINEFTKSFKLLPHIKFLKHVVKINTLPEDRWRLTIQDLITKDVEEKEFDAVMVCVGHYSVPNMPHFEGVDLFKGHVIHSHEYRKSEPYVQKKVVIIGSGPSAVDIARIVGEKAEKVIISFRGELYGETGKNILKKPLAIKFKENSVVFKDNSEEEIDAVIFCTGYLVYYPFLSRECGIEVENNWVKYIYKHIINVKKPTMAFIGVPMRVFPFPLFDVQARYFLAYLNGQFSVTETEMMNSIMTNVQQLRDSNVPPRDYHRIGHFNQGKYFKDLTDQAKISPAPPVLGNLYIHVHTVKRGDRTTIYRILDDEEFIQIGTHQN